MSDFSAPLSAGPLQTPMDALQQLQTNDALNSARSAQGATAVNDLQAKQRSMQASMINAAVNSPDPVGALKNIIPIANRLNPSYQYDPEMDVATAKASAMGTLPLGEQPEYQLKSQQAAMLNALRARLAGYAPDQTQPASGGSPASSVPPGLNLPPMPGDGGLPMDQKTQDLLAVVNPAAATALSTVQKTSYDSPAGQERTAIAKKTGENIADAQKGVAGIDSRLQNAIDILNEQIKLAPNTAVGDFGPAQVALDRDLTAAHIRNSPLPANQAKFEQNNANLFTQELPAILSGMPGSRLDIPLVNAIKQASQIDKFGTSDEKIAAAQGLKQQLMRYQQNTHNNAAAMGAGNVPIPSINDANPPSGATAQANKKLNGGNSASTLIVKTQAAFDSLPKGSTYVEIGPDGNPQTFRKP